MSTVTRKVETLTLPGIGDVTVKSLRLTTYLEVAAKRGESGSVSELSDTEFLIYLMSETIYDADGKKVFENPEQWDEYLGVNMSAAASVFEAVRRVTGLGADSGDAEKK